MNTNILIIAGIFGVLFIVITLWVTNSSTKKKKQNLKNLIIDRNASVVYDEISEDNSENSKKENKETDKSSIAKKLKNARNTSQDETMSLTSIKYLLIQAGLETPVYRFWIYSVISCFTCFLLASTFGVSKIVLILWTFTGMFGIPKFILKKKVSRRQLKFLKEFADCLDAMTRLLKSGMPISEAIAMTSREYTGPIGEEMTKVYEDQRVGDTLPEAVQKMAFRVPLPEIKMFSTAVTIQTQTGSSLSEVLQNLSNVIRQRFKLKRKIQALSSEAKISAGIIGCLPLVVVGSMYLINPDYISLLWSNNTGKFMLYGGIGWMGIGMMVMKSMINFKI